MLLKISNLAREYAWGSHTLIPDYFATPATGRPMAEIWFGTHPSNSSIVDDEKPVTLLEKLGHELPFLLKILAAAQPLSIQAHPNSEEAAEGFARENALGLALDSATRNYRDDKHKPEMLVALSPFEALVGFREVDEVREIFEAVGQSEDQAVHEFALEALRKLASNKPVKSFFEWLIAQRGELELQITGCVQRLNELAQAGLFAEESALANRLCASYAGDPGVLIALSMNLVRLEPNEAVFLPAGVIHAYLEGLGVEVMAASDNVLRGGLTPKHIDTAELTKVLSFKSGEWPKVQQRELAIGLTEYPAGLDDFQLYRVDVSGENLLADLTLPGESVVLCTSGEVAVSNSLEERIVLTRGEAAYLSGDARLFTFAGSGTAFLATSAAS